MKEEIAQKLEMAFSELGFTEPSVPVLKNMCGVSLRTLYKYYPSKELMIIAALEHRHKRYLSQIESTEHDRGFQAIVEVFKKLEDWMGESAPNGCLSLNALAAFPENEDISRTVKAYKLSIHALLAEKSGDIKQADTLFLLHEGVTSSWPVFGRIANQSAIETIKQIYGVLK